MPSRRAGRPTLGPRGHLRAVTLDVDGTLTTEHGWHYLARHRGRLAEYEGYQREFLSGAVGEDAHLVDLLRLSQGMSLRELAHVLEETPRLRGIREAVRTLQREGVWVGLLTHNPSPVCRWYARAYDLDGWVGVRQGVRGGRLQAVREMHVDKVAALALLRRRLGVPWSSLAHIGDGSADARVFPYVGWGIALNPQSRAVARAADATVRSADLRAILPVLERIPPKRPRRAPRFSRSTVAHHRMGQKIS